MKLNDEDIAVVEFMHDRLLEVYNEKQNVDYLVKARKTTNKMYSIVSDAKTRTEPALPIQNVTKRFFSWGDILIGFVAGVFGTIIALAYIF